MPNYFYYPCYHSDCKSQFTLEGSQPYNLSGSWPNRFIKSQTTYVPDYSLIHVKSYNPTKCKYTRFNQCKKK